MNRLIAFAVASYSRLFSVTKTLQPRLVDATSSNSKCRFNTNYSNSNTTNTNNNSSSLATQAAGSRLVFSFFPPFLATCSAGWWGCAFKQVC
jgi:hypothetical protein